VIAILLVLLGTARAQDPALARPEKANFETFLAEATGPDQLSDLRKECVKAGLEEEKKKVEAILSRVKPPAKPGADYLKREQLRERRTQARRAVGEFRSSRGRDAAAQIRKVVTWMKEQGYGPAAARARIKDLARRLVTEAAEAAPLLKEIDALPAGEGTPAQAKEFDSRVGGLVKELTDRLCTAVDKCLAANEPGLAFDLFQFLLQVDPESPRAHKSLGHVKIQDRWLRPYEYQQFKNGLVWDPKLGWIVAKEKAKYDAGEYYDLEAKRWAPVTEVNKEHSDPARPWRMKGEHFELVSTADLELTVKVLARLEAFFLQAFGEYDLFFAKGSSGTGAQLIFGVAPVDKRLTVTFYRDAAQFKAHAKPPTDWAAGFYSGGSGGSFFYAFGGKMSVGVLQHELTHQILGEFSAGHAPSWLSEGAAVYLQDAEFRDGILTLPPPLKNHRVADYRANLKAGKKEHSFKEMIRFGNGQSWDSGDISSNYRGAGAIVTFLIHFDGGRYRGDFLDLLRDAYNGGARPLEDYFGLSIDSLDFLQDRFYRECAVR
jgi:hypothetical protein